MQALPARNLEDYEPIVGTPHDYATARILRERTANPLANPIILAALCDAVPGDRTTARYSEATEVTTTRFTPDRHIPRFVVEVLTALHPDKMGDKNFDAMVVHRAYEMQHVLHLTLYMAYHDAAMMDWMKNNVKFTSMHCQAFVDAANTDPAYSICKLLLDMGPTAAAYEPRAVLLQFPTGSGKTIMQQRLIAELVERAKARIVAGTHSMTHLPHPGAPVVVLLPTMAERDAFAALLAQYPVFDNVEDIFVITESFRKNRALKADAIGKCYVLVSCLAGVLGTCSTKVNNDAAQASLDALSARMADGTCLTSEVGQLMTSLLRAKVPTQARRDLLIAPVALIISEFNASMAQLTQMLKMCPTLNDILMLWSRTADLVVLDGTDLGDEAVVWAANTKGLHNTRLWCCYAPPLTRKTIQLEPPLTFFDGLDSALKSGELVVINCDTVRATSAIQKELTTTYGLSASDVFVCTGLDDQDHKGKLADLAHICSTHKVVLTSPVLLRGISDARTAVRHHYILLSGATIDGIDVVQLSNRQRLSETVHVCVLSHEATSTSAPADVGMFIAKAVHLSKFTGSGISSLSFRPLVHAPSTDPVSNAAHQRGSRVYAGGAIATGAGPFDAPTDEGLLLMNTAPASSESFFYCECMVPKMHRFDVCAYCGCVPIEMHYKAQATEGNPFLNVEDFIPHWPAASGANPRTAATNLRFLKAREYTFDRVNSTLGGVRPNPAELIALMFRARKYKRAFRFTRRMWDSFRAEGYEATVIRGDPGYSGFVARVTPSAKALQNAAFGTGNAATLRLSELIGRLTKQAGDYSLERRIQDAKALLAFDPDIDNVEFATRFGLFELANWHSGPVPKEPNFFPTLFSHLGVASSLSPEWLDATLECLGNRPIEWHKLRPTHFDIGTKADAYQTWLLQHLWSFLTMAIPTPALAPTGDAYPSPLLKCLESTTVQWAIPFDKKDKRLSAFIRNPDLCGRVEAFLAGHAESVFLITDGKSDLRATPVKIQGLFDATSNVMDAVLKMRLGRRNGRAARTESGQGRTRRSEPVIYTFPVDAAVTRLIAIYARAQRGVDTNGALTNDGIIDLLKGGLAAVPEEEWWVGGLSGVEHPKVKYPYLNPNRRVGPRVGPRVGRQTDRLATYTSAVRTYLSANGHPEKDLPPSSMRALISSLFASGLDVAAAYTAHRARMDLLTGDLYESDSGSDSDSDAGDFRQDLQRFYEEESEAEEEADMARRNTTTNHPSESESESESEEDAPPSPKRRRCRFIEEEAASGSGSDLE